MPLSVEDLNEVTPAKKGKDYCIRNARSMHTSNNTSNSFYYNQKIKWELNRKYERGEQPIDNAKSVMGRNNQVNFDNLNWNVPKALPIIFDIMVGIINRLEIDIITEAIDPESMDRRVKERAITEAEIMLKKELMELEAVSGRQIINPQNQYNDIEELQIDIDSGMFKLDVEIAFEELIDLVFDYNRVHALRRTLVRDGANCGMAVLRHYVTNNGLIKVRRVDPVNFISNYVTTPDFNELSQAGEYMFLNMARLREISDFSDDEYVDIALNVAGKFGNPPLTNLGNSIALYRNPIGGGYVFDPYIVCVLYAEWETTDRYYFLKDKPNKFGIPKTIEVENPADLSKSDSKYLIHKDYKVWYCCNWLIDTDYAFDYGKVQFPNATRSALNEPQSTFAVAAIDINNMVTTTYTERLQAVFDMAYLNWMQYQSHLAKAVPPGVYAEVMALTNIPNGKNGVLSPLEVIDRYVATGNLLGNSMLPNGQVMQRMPIEPLNGSDYSKAVGFYQQFLAQIELCKQLVGLNEFTDASNPNPEKSVGGAKLAVQGTDNSLQPLIAAIDLVLEKTAEGVVNRAQNMAAKGELDYLASALGRTSLIALNVTSEMSASAMGIKMNQRMDEADKMRLQGYINQSLSQRAQTGVGGIEVEDAIAIERIKNIKHAERMLIKRRALRKKEDAERAKSQSEYNSKVQQDSIAAKFQADQALKKQEFDDYIRKKEADLKYLREEKEIDFEYDAKLKRLETEGKDENIITQGLVDAKLTEQEAALLKQKEKEEANV